jgi:hypothetical protein
LILCCQQQCEEGIVFCKKKSKEGGNDGDMNEAEQERRQYTETEK